MNQDTTYTQGAVFLDFEAPEENPSPISWAPIKPPSWASEDAWFGLTEIHPQAKRFTSVQECQSATQYDMPGIITQAAALPKRACVCGEPHSQGTVHRLDGPCHQAPPKHKPALAGFDSLAGFDHRPGGWGAV